MIARLVVLVAAVCVAAFGFWRGTWAVGGSDSSCYALMAATFAGADVQPTSTLADAPWPDAGRTLAPGGFIPSDTRPGAASPVCTPGFSLLLAPLYALGGRDGIFLLTPFAGAALVALTFAASRPLVGAWPAAAAAIVVATMPVLLFQVVQPMNDVAAAAAWMAVVALAVRPGDHSAWIGVFTGLAILVRPNLAPAAGVVALWCLGGGVRRLLVFGASAAPFAAAVVVFNTLLYGHPLDSGYGATRELFSVAHVLPNLQNYGRALFATTLGFPLLALAAPVVVPRHLRPVVALPLGISAAVVAVYLLYRPFPEWWYLRFLLPALPMLTILAVVALVLGSRRTTVVWPVVAVLVGYAATSDATADALNLHRLERRFRTVGDVVRERLPEQGVFLTVWESGTIRYHAGREVVVWDSLEPAALDSALEWLASRGMEPFIVVEQWEEPVFRERFEAHSDIGKLDWPPRFVVERQVRIYRAGDRRLHVDEGRHVPTEVVVTRERR